MRIGIDARSILNPEKGDAIGAGHYTYQLIRHLLEIDQENEYVLFFDFRVREKDVKKFSRPNVKIKFFPFSDYKKYLPGAYNEILGAATFQGEKLDVLHSTSAQNRIPLSYGGKVAVTFHDMSAFEIPGHLSTIKAAKDRAVLKMMASKADRVIAVSESLKQELKKHLSVREKQIDVVYSGVDERFFVDNLSDNSEWLQKKGISKKYILFLGTLEPSKNLTRLLRAFAKFKAKRKQANGDKFDYQLVLAGKRGWQGREFETQARELGLAKDVVFPGYVGGDDLVGLFKRAEFFIMPSLYEGFGMTVLEALATGAPTVVARTCSLPELAGENAYYIDPLKTEEIITAIEKFALEPEACQTYRGRGIEQARKFAWRKTAEATLKIYRELAGK